MSARGLVASCAGVGALTALVFLLVTASLPIALCFALFGGWLPLVLVSWRAKRRSAALRELWPDVVDHLRSAIRRGRVPAGGADPARRQGAR